MSELKPCPFCGSDEVSVHHDEYWDSYWVSCICNATITTQENDDDKHVKAAWNRRTQPEATKPAQDLGVAILAIEYGADYADPCKQWAFDAGFKAALKAAAALASPADALVAVDRVDAERYRHLRELMQFSTPPNKPTTMKLRAALPAPEHQPHRDWMGEHFDASVDRTVDADIRACLTAEEIPEFDASRAAIQAQKDGQ